MFTPNTVDQAILDKLREYLPGLSGMTDAQLWLSFVNAWNKLMAILCWNDGECNSLISAQRNLKVKLEDKCFPIEVPLYHTNVTDIESAVIKWLTDTGFQQQAVSGDLMNFFDGEKLYITPSSSLQVAINSCSGVVNIEVTYTAGYAEIPECFYTALSEIIGISLCQQNNCFENTEDCYALDRKALNAVLTERTIGDETWKWETPNNFLVDTISNLQSKGSLKLLGQFSNCVNKLNFVA